jgi:hypothetical protein
MQEVIRFEEAFTTLIELNFNDIYTENGWKYNQAQRQVNYQILFDSLLALLTAQVIDYDNFIEQEWYAWSTPTSNGNPMALPFTEAFLPLYTRPNYKYYFLYICMQSQAPAKNISAALLHACYFEVRDNLDACFGISTLLDFLGDYPNPAAVEFIDYILPYVNDDWYGQDLVIHLPYVLKINPSPAATALMAKWKVLEAKLEAARRI